MAAVARELLVYLLLCTPTTCNGEFLNELKESLPSRMPVLSRQQDVVAVSFFGLNRSLKWLVNDIRRRILDPIKRDCLVPEVYVHTYSLNATLASHRSGEAPGIGIGGWEEMRDMLQPFAMEVTDQNELISSYKRHPPFTAGLQPSFRVTSTARNWLAQLYSLLRVTILWMPRANSLRGVVFVRPDMRPIDSLDTVALVSAASDEVFVPWWQSWGGQNDRFAFAQPRAAAAYGLRSLLLADFACANKAAKSEMFNDFALKRTGIHVRFTSGLTQRVRANGATDPRDIGLSRVSWDRCSKRQGDFRNQSIFCSSGPLPKEAHELASDVKRTTLIAGGPYGRPPPVCAHIPEFATLKRRACIFVFVPSDKPERTHFQMAKRLYFRVLQPLHSACVVTHAIISSSQNLSPEAAQTWRSTLSDTSLGLTEVMTLPSPAAKAATLSSGALRFLALRAVRSHHMVQSSYVLITIALQQSVPVRFTDAAEAFGLRNGHVQVENGFADQPDTSPVAMCQVSTAVAYSKRQAGAVVRTRETESNGDATGNGIPRCNESLPWLTGGFVIAARRTRCTHAIRMQVTTRTAKSSEIAGQPNFLGGAFGLPNSPVRSQRRPG
mmetsp:Transcript_5425/g.16142  ORF Transcript_5425/g.16142 Transcript_5425/m.16142 type:complete len:609 (+) Transcript_5425:447-2273(+)